MKKINLNKNKWIPFLMLLFVCLSLPLMAGPELKGNPYSPANYQATKAFYGLTQGMGSISLVSTEVLAPASPNDQIETKVFKLKFTNLYLNGGSEFRIRVKLPKNQNRPLPAIVFFTGFETTDKVVNLVSHQQDSIYIGLEYPIPLELTPDSLLINVKKIENIPVLMAGTVKWLKEVPDEVLNVDTTKVNVVAVSFGSVFYPLAHRFLQDEGLSPKTVVLAYGGAFIPEILLPLIDAGGDPGRQITNAFFAAGQARIAKETWYGDPLYHLSSMTSSPLLFVSGSQDKKFSKASIRLAATELESLSNVRKIDVPGPHISPDNPGLINHLMEMVKQFISENQGL